MSVLRLLPLSVTGIVIVMTLSAVPSARQRPSPREATKKATSTWTLPRTPAGQPDLQGVWVSNSATPLERPEALEGRQFLTDEEVAARQKEQNDLQARKDALVQKGEGQELGLRGKPAGKDDSITGFEYNTFWVDTGSAATVFRRTSLITGPEGRIPYKPEVLERIKYSTEVVSSRPPADFVNRSWRDRDLGERCMTDGVLAMFWSGTGPSQIIQGPGYVAIMTTVRATAAAEAEPEPQLNELARVRERLIVVSDVPLDIRH